LQNKGNAELEPLIESFSGSQRHVADYLIKEVFESQPEPIQSFLLKTCFFRVLTSSLCDVITDTTESAALLERLARDNLFLEQLGRSGNQTWYRYNPLFAESIEYVARQRFNEADVQSLFEKASNWYEYHGLLNEAVETTLASGSSERVIVLVKKFMDISDITEWQTLMRWLEKIPRELVVRDPIICFAYAQMILYSSDRFAPATLAKIDPFLREAEEKFSAEENHKGIGEVLSFRGVAHWWRGDLQKAFEYAHRSLEELPESDVMYRGTSLLILTYQAVNAGRILHAQDLVLEGRALLGAAQNIYGVLAAIQMLSEVFFLQGELEQSEQLNQQVLVEAVGDESMLDDQGIASLSLARIAYERNDLDQAESFASRALELGGQRANETLQMQATVQLALIQAAKGNLTRARELVKSFEAKIHGPIPLREIQNAQALFAIRANDISSMDWWVKIVSTENLNAFALQKEREAFIQARLKIAEGKTKEALGLLSSWNVDSAVNGRIRSYLEALCLEALAHHADSNLPETVRALSEALTIGQAKGFRRTFLDEGTRMAAMLQATLPSLHNQAPSTTLRTRLGLFVSTLLHSFPAEATAHLTATDSRVQIEALSQQELRVLRVLAAGLSNADIAQELVVSTNTIKTHVKSIYRKLNVSSREEAREVARELKLL